MAGNTIKLKEPIFAERLQYLVFLALSLGVIGLASDGYIANKLLFQKYFGSINPLIALTVITLLGIILFSTLLSRGWFAIYQRGNRKALLLSSGLASLFAFVIVLVDLRVVFPDDINVLFPESLLFYPAIGFAVEILFHLLPLTLLLILLTSISKNLNYNQIIWPCILIVSLFEPVFQTIAGYSKPYSIWVMGYVGLHIFSINFTQLLIFKRYDFISMYLFRLVYYLLWHIAWGHMRLKLLIHI